MAGKLLVNGIESDLEDLNINCNGDNKVINFQHNGTTVAKIDKNGLQGQVEAFTVDNGNVVYTGTGKIGIGTNSPTDTLDVNGSAKVGYLLVAPQDANGYEGGEINLKGSGSSPDIHIDNGGGSLRVHTLAAGKSVEIIGGAGLHVVNGHIKAPNQPGFYAYGTGGVTYMTSGDVNPTFNYTYGNKGNHYSTSTGVFTAPETGMYSFTLTVYCHTATGHNRLKIHTSAGMQAYWLAHTMSSDHSEGVSVSLWMAAGDYVYPTVQSDHSNAYYRHSNHTNFSGFMIS